MNVEISNRFPKMVKTFFGIKAITQKQIQKKLIKVIGAM